jgi:alkylated DNA repair dioxygenase AlkB
MRTGVRYAGAVPVYQPSLLEVGAPRIVPSAPAARLRLDDTAWIDVVRGFLRGTDTLMADLVEHVDWRRGRRHMYERMVDDPRLSRWYPLDETPPSPVLVDAREALEQRYGVPFGAVGLNYYRDGRDSVAFHRDRELRDVDDALVAIVTLGSTRPFRVRPRGGGASRDLAPGRGDLVVMGGTCPRDWEHAVPKTRRGGPRLSLSWRWSADPVDATPDPASGNGARISASGRDGTATGTP